MPLYFRYTTFVFLLVFVKIAIFAQSSANYGDAASRADPDKKAGNGSLAGTWEAGAMLGPDFFYGDLSPKKFLPSRNISAAGGLFLMRHFTNVVGLKGQLLFGGLNGSKDGQEGSKPVNWNFKGTFIDFTINSVFNLSNIVSPYYDGRRVFVYGTIGLGVNAWNSTLNKSDNGVSESPDQAKGMQAALVVPLGLGIQFAVTNKIDAGAEYSVRTIFSDRVDQTVGGFKWDFVNLLAFTASYRFGVSKKNINVQEYSYSNPVTYRPRPSVSLPVSVAEPVRQSQEIPSASEVYDYVVQVCAFAKHDYTVAWVKKHYHLDMPVIKETENGLNRYIIGHYYKDLNIAKELCNRIRKQGIHDAWVIAYQNGVRHHVVVY
jgi:opacity protein-like surface antigen